MRQETIRKDKPGRKNRPNRPGGRRHAPGKRNDTPFPSFPNCRRLERTSSVLPQVRHAHRYRAGLLRRRSRPPKGLSLVRQRSIRPKDQGRRRPYSATGERTLLFLLLARILFPALPARVVSLHRPFPTIAVTHRADIRIADPADRLLQLYQPQLLPDPSTDTDHTHAEADGSHTSGDELPAVSGYIPHGRHRFPAIVADRPRPDPRFQPDHVRKDHHRIFSEQAGATRYLRTNPDHVRYPSLLHEPENRQPDG